MEKYRTTENEAVHFNLTTFFSAYKHYILTVQAKKKIFNALYMVWFHSALVCSSSSF